MSKFEELIVDENQMFTHQLIGLCAGVGISEVEVYTSIKAAIISTGDEVFPIQATIDTAQVHDVNRAILSSILRSMNVSVLEEHLIQDDEELLFSTVNRLKDLADLILISGGSSQGEKDYTAKIIDRCQNPGVWSHGLAIKPGKPTIVGSSGSCLIIGLPGHPVSAMTVFLRVIKTAYQQAFNLQIKKNLRPTGYQCDEFSRKRDDCLCSAKSRTISNTSKYCLYKIRLDIDVETCGWLYDHTRKFGGLSKG
jgi:molybdopterin molybdotransferase